MKTADCIDNIKRAADIQQGVRTKCHWTKCRKTKCHEQNASGQNATPENDMTFGQNATRRHSLHFRVAFCPVAYVYMFAIPALW